MTLTRVNTNGITDGTVVNADVSASAAIAGTKVSPDFGSQTVTTTGTSTAASFIPTSSSVPANGVYLPGANSLGLATASTERVRVTSAGLVGIGTTSPVAHLSVYGDTVDLVQAYIENNNAAGASGSNRRLFLAQGGTTASSVAVWQNAGVVESTGAGGGLALGAYSAASTDPIKFYTGPVRAERARIDGSGRLLVGTSSISSGNGTLYVQEDANSVRNCVAVNNTATGTSSVGFVAFYRSGTFTGGISNTGSATAYNTSSDYRLKENVEAFTDGISRLQQLKPSRFNFIVDPGKTVDGFIAHEVQDVVPECVTGTKDAVDADGNPLYQGIDQSKLVPLLTAALQEAIAKIETLEARLTALEGA